MRKRNTSAQSNYWRKALGKHRSTPILFSIWECLNFRPDKKPKHATSLIKPWLAVFRSLWHPKQGMPSQICSQSKRRSSVLVSVKTNSPSPEDRRESVQFLGSAVKL